MLQLKQECIPVGCVPPAAVAVGGGAGQFPLNFPPWVWAWTRSLLTSPLGVGLDQIPLNFPLGCGSGPDPPQLPPWLWAWRPPDQAPPPLWTEFLTHASENITLLQTSFAGGNYSEFF